MELAYDPQVGIDRFEAMWQHLPDFDLDYDYLIPRYSHSTYTEMGYKILRDWWSLIQWDTDIVLAREYPFEVPIGDGNTLAGIADKVCLRTQKDGSTSVLISDYKTGSKQPTRDYLAHDVQFSAYCYASTQREFWDNIPDGSKLFVELGDAMREGEWVHLRGPKRIPAGPRTEMHYNRLRYAVDQIEQSIALGIFVPDLSGETCEWCEFRKICGLPTRAQEGLE